MARRQRLDRELLDRGLARSRAQAELLIAERQVTVNGAVALKAAHLVAPADAIELLASNDWHSRGFDKLFGALHDCRIVVADKQCLDVGASTGGFVQALLDAGARSVAAIDVGTAQLDVRLRGDGRVAVHEQTDIRSYVWTLPSPPDLITVDVSFISVTKIAAALRELAGPATELLILIKPQFEVDRAIASRHRGVIREITLHAEVLARVLSSLAEHGLVTTRLVPSRRKGTKGNQEYFAYAYLGTLPAGDIAENRWQSLIGEALGTG